MLRFKTKYLGLLLVGVFCFAAASAPAQTWVPRDAGTSSGLLAIAFIPSTTNGVVFGNLGTDFLFTSDNGATWQTLTQVQSVPFSRTDFADPAIGVAVGFFGNVIRSIDGGTTWNLETSGTIESLRSVDFADLNTVVAVGDAGAIIRSTDQGVNWTAVPSGTTQNLRNVHFANASSGTAVGTFGVILRTDDGGVSWGVQEAGITDDVLGVHMIDFQNIIVVGAGDILRSDEGGVTWQAITNPGVGSLRDVHFKDALNGVAVGDFSTIVTTDDGGLTWVTEDAGLSSVALSDVTHNGDGSSVTVGPGGTILQRVNPGDVLWIEQFGSASLDFPRAIATNTSGTAYVGGITFGTLPGQSSQGGNDAFVTKYDTDGVAIFTTQFGTTANDAIRGVAEFGGNVLVGGFTVGALPGQTLTGNVDGFVRLYDQDVVEQWTRQFGVASEDVTVEAAAADASGLYIAGEISDGGELPGETANGARDGFVRKYDDLGNVVWTTQFGAAGAESDGVNSIHVDASGVYIAGTLSGEPNFAYLRKLDLSGNEAWLRVFPTAMTEGHGVTGDGTAVYIVGLAGAALPGQTLLGGGGDAFIRSYDHNGNIFWTRQFGTTSFEFATAVSSDATGIFVTGGTSGTFPGLTSQGAQDVFVCEYDATGAQVWSSQFGSAGSETAAGIANGSAFIAGNTNGTLPGGTNAGLTDGFVAKIETGPGPAPTGNIVIDSFSAPGTGVEGTVIDFETFATISNPTADDITTSFSVGFYYSPDDFVDPAVATLLVNGRVTVPNLAAGETLDIQTPEGLAIPFGLPTGVGFLAVLVDEFDEVLETNESDNDNTVNVFIVGDADGDGVSDGNDLCPAENASFFDKNDDGCIDDAIGARSLEFWDSGALPYSINQNGAAGISDGSDITAVQNGFSNWTTLPNVTISATFAGTTPQQDADPFDQVNLVTFEDPDFVFPTGVIAVGISTSFTVPTLIGEDRFRPGEIIDGDIIMNSNFEFSTPTAGTGKDIESVATHEAGHVFGISHSAVETSTMFFRLPAAADAATLEAEDITMMTKAYPGGSVLLDGRLEGTVIDNLGNPVHGAIVYAIDAATGDTLGCDYTLPLPGTPEDGGFEFIGLPPSDYFVAIHPLDGSSKVGFIQPANINALIFANAQTLFVPEFYDAAESATDDPAAMTSILITSSGTEFITIVTNIDNTAPTADAGAPEDDATDVAVDGAILVDFSEAMDINTIAGNFRLFSLPDTTFVAGNAALLNDDATLAFIPSGNLDFSTGYQIEVDTGFSDKFGNGLASLFQVNFATEAQPPVFIESLAPNIGVEATVVVISGDGYDTTPGANIVDFNGTSANVVSATTTQLVVEVPAGAASGPVTVMNNVIGQTSNAVTFTVLNAEDAARGVEVGVADLGELPNALAVLPSGASIVVATEAGAAIVDSDFSSPNFMSVTPLAIAGGLDDIDVTPDGARVYAVEKTGQKFYRIGIGAGPAVLAEVNVGAAPLGVTVDPAGRRAYVPTDNGRIQIWDTNPGSATFDNKIGEIVPPDPVREGLAFDPSGNLLLALSSTNKLFVFDLGGDSLLATIPVGTDPRDIVVDPVGQRAYIADAGGFVTVVSLTLLSHVTDITTGGVLRGVDITPSANFLYAANRELNFLDVIDLKEASATFRTVIANIPVRVNPIAVELSPDGQFAYSLSEQERRLVATAIGIGPVLNSMSRYAGPIGTELVLAGSGFTSEATTTVSFGGVIASTTRLGDSLLTVTVPSGATDGPVSVLTQTAPGPVFPSNALFFDVLGTSLASQALRLSAVVPAPAALQLVDVLAVSPIGNVVTFVSDGGAVFVLDTRASSPTFNEIIGNVATGLPNIEDIAITPDGKRAYALDETNVALVDIDPNSPTFNTLLNTINLDVSDTGYSHLAVSLDGQHLILSDRSTSRVNIADIRPGSPTENTVLMSTTLFGTPPGSSGIAEEIALHPGGEFAYIAIDDATPSSIAVLNVNPLSPNFGDRVTDLLLAQSTVPVQLSFTPNGDSLYVHRADAVGTGRFVVIVNTTDPSSPVIDDVQSIGIPAARMEDHVRVSPAGDRATFNITTDAVHQLDVTQTPVTTIGSFSHALTSNVVDFDYAIDAKKLYLTSQSEDSLYIFDFTEAMALSKVSGDDATGVVGEVLPQAIRVQVSEGASGVAGVSVVFDVSAGGGSFATSNPLINPTMQTVTTDAGGFAQVNWRLGTVSGVNSQQVGVTSLGLSGSPTQFTASTVNDPNTLPLQLVSIVPATGQSDVNITTAIQATLSRSVSPITVAPTTFFLRETASSIPVPTVIGITDQDRKLSLTPEQPLVPNTQYTIELTGGIFDLGGGALQNPLVAQFTTAPALPLVLSAVSPPSSKVGVPVVLSGTGFSEFTFANTVLFNGLPANVTSASNDFIDVIVPPGATSGDVFVVAEGDTSNSIAFLVLVPSTSPVDDVVSTTGTGSSTRAIAIAPDGAFAYAVSPDGDVVIPINLSTLQSEQPITVGDNPFAVAINPDGTFAYVTNRVSGTMSVLDINPASPGFHTLNETVVVGQTPGDLLVTPDGDRVIVVNEGSGSLSVVDSDSLSETFNSVVSTVTKGSTTRGIAIAPDGGLLYVGTDEGYLVLDALSFAVVSTVTKGSSSRSIAIAPDGAFLIQLTMQGQVVIFDVQPGSLTENQVVSTVTKGSTTRSIRIAPDGGLIFLIEEEDDLIIVISLGATGGSSATDQLPDGIVSPVTVNFVDTLMAGEDPTDVAFDPRGNGRFAVTNAGDNTVTIFGGDSTLKAAEVTVLPHTILVDPAIGGCTNSVYTELASDAEILAELGRYLRAWIELPDGCDPNGIEASTVLMNGVIPALEVATPLDDIDGDGVFERQFKFDRVLFESVAPQGESVQMPISGAADGKPFQGEATIRTIRPTLTLPVGGEELLADQTTTLTWDSPATNIAIASVSIAFTPDDGETWLGIATGAPNTGAFEWSVPNMFSETARVMVTLLADDCEPLGSTISPNVFSIVPRVPVLFGGFEVTRAGRAARVEWQTLVETNSGGFDLLRSTSRDHGYARMNTEVIPPRGGVNGADYLFIDETVRPNQTYYYKLVEVTDRGDGSSFGPFEFVYRAAFVLEQNIPNPFNPTTLIRFTLPQDDHVRLTIFDVKGRRVRTLVNEERQANHYEVKWDGRDQNGNQTATGVYFYKIQAGKQTQTRKMILLK